MSSESNSDSNSSGSKSSSNVSGSGSVGSGSNSGSVSSSASRSSGSGSPAGSGSDSRSGSGSSSESRSGSSSGSESSSGSTSSSSAVPLASPSQKKGITLSLESKFNDVSDEKSPAPLKLPANNPDEEAPAPGPMLSPRSRQATGQLLVSPRRATRAKPEGVAVETTTTKDLEAAKSSTESAEKFEVEEFWTVGTFTDAAYAWRTYLAEFLAVTLFVFMGTGVVVVTAGRTEGVDGGTIVAIGFGFGFAIATMVYAAANLSGGHLNPAVTIAIFTAMKMPLLQAIGYIIAQVLGGMVGSALVLAVTPYDIGKACNWGATTLAKDARYVITEFVNVSGVVMPQLVTKTYSLTMTQGFFLELIMTFILVFTVFSTAGVAVDAKSVGRFAPLSIGFAVFINVMIGATLTGGSLNPARSFGPALVSGAWENHWIYWGGPIAGGILAGLCFKYVFVTKEEMRAQVRLAEKLEKDALAAAALEQERVNRKGR